MSSIEFLYKLIKTLKLMVTKIYSKNNNKNNIEQRI